MFAFCNIGMTKQGKSRKAREMITKHPMDTFGALVNDVNNEYGDFRRDRESGISKPSTGLQLVQSLNESNSRQLYRSRYGGANATMKEYLQIVRTKEYTTVIFEECTAFFKGRTPPNLCEMIINKGHTINNYIFQFHSIRSVPPELLGLMDYVNLFKTNDNEEIVAQKDQKLLPYWLDLQTKPDGAAPHVINWLEAKPFQKEAYLDLKRKYGMIR